MLRLQYIIIVGMFLLLGTTVRAQNLATDLAKMQSAYLKAQRMHMKTVTKEFEEGEPNAVVEEATIMKDGSKYLYSMQGKTFLMNDVYVIVVDEESKQIQCISRKNKDLRMPKNLDPMAQMNQVNTNFDSLVKTYEEVKYLGLKNGKKRYSMTMPGQQVISAEMAFDAQSFLLSDIKYVYNEEWYGKSYITISLPIMDVNPTFKENTFSEWNFLKKEGGKLKPNDQYKEYELIVLQ